MSTPTAITLAGLSKHYPPLARTSSNQPTKAVDDVDLHIPAGDLFFLLGPSGCGKTTILRMIAGFIEPTAGRIAFNDRDVTHLTPNKRNTGMVFQSYALWPHMTVAQNVAFGLSIRRVPKEQRDDRVHQALRSVRMDAYADRKPQQLSGGQQQRVALARALVVQPDVLLLDEPLSNLDAKLRLEMRHEIRRLCTETGITTVYVTHDQKEALSMADNVAVLDMGVIAQTGHPRTLYTRPATRFVADFLGETNFLHAAVTDHTDSTLTLDSPLGPLTSATFPNDPAPAPGSEVLCSLRPEAFRLDRPARPVPDAAASTPNTIHAPVAETIYLGEMAQHLLQPTPDITLKAFELHPPPPQSPPHSPLSPPHSDNAADPPSNGVSGGASGGGSGGAANLEHLTLTIAPEDVVVLHT